MPFEVNYKEDNQEALERGRTPPADWFHAVVEDAKEEDNGSYSMVYLINKGPWEGSKIQDTIFNPDNSETAKGAEGTMKRLKLMGTRLGIVQADQFGKDENLSLDFVDALGKEVVIHTVHKPDKTDKTKVWCNLDFAGVYPLDSDKIPMEKRAELGLPVLESQVKEAAEKAANGGKKPRKAKGPPTPVPVMTPADDPALTDGL